MRYLTAYNILKTQVRSTNSIFTMPKAPSQKRTTQTSITPYARPRSGTTLTTTATNTNKIDRSSRSARQTTNKSPSQSKAKSKVKDPKASHLYTDDNPSTTLHGTGFKNADVAHHTLNLVQGRSLTYQFQTINTMYWRAKHHKQFSSSLGMQEAVEVFGTWLNETYPGLKAESGRFKPLLKRDIVDKYLSHIEEIADRDENGKDYVDFARLYVNLPKGKRLGNVLVDDTKPEGPDWEVLRERRLDELMQKRDQQGLKGEEGLWVQDYSEKKTPSDWHIRCIALAWSSLSEKKL